MGNSLQKPTYQTLENPQKEEENASSFTCEICIELTAANNKFKNKNLCSHPFCKDCIACHIEAKIQDNTAKIRCPGLDCPQILDPISCKPLVPENLFTKWCDLLCENYVLWFERSYCPNRNCNALVVNECERKGRVKKAQCPICSQWFCFQCKLGWHAGYGCEESRNFRDPNDIEFGQLVEEMSWARCPSCGHCVELIDGCRRIFCRCGTYFCYFCGRKYPLECVCFSNRLHRCFLFFSLALIILIGIIYNFT